MSVGKKIMSQDYLFITWTQSTRDSLLGPFTVDTCVLFQNYYILYDLIESHPSPNFLINDLYDVIYNGVNITNKIRVYIQFYFTTNPNGTYTVGLIQTGRTGCRRESILEVVQNTIFTGYPYIGNAIIDMDGTNETVDPIVDKLNSWYIFLKATTGSVPIFSSTGKDNKCYVSFTPYNI